MLRLISALALLLPAMALAVPATVNVTVTSLTDDGTGGAPAAFRLHLDCNLAGQSVGPVLADPAVINGVYQIPDADTDETYTLCAVAYNYDADGQEQAGGFANVVTLAFDGVVIPPPGGATVILSCEVRGAVIANCVQTNNP